jgi:transcriptional regulator with XRE-family HTH domain
MSLKLIRKPCHHCGGAGTLDVAIPNSAREERHKAKLTLKELSGRMGIHQTYLHDLETGKRPFNRKQIDAFEKALGEKRDAED